MINSPFAYGNDFLLLMFTPEGNGVRCSCSCGWRTEAAAPAWMVDRAKDVHLDEAHPGVPPYLRQMPVDLSALEAMV